MVALSNGLPVRTWSLGVRTALSRAGTGLGTSRQRIYREHAFVVAALTGTAQQQEREQWQATGLRTRGTPTAFGETAAPKRSFWTKKARKEYSPTVAQAVGGQFAKAVSSLLKVVVEKAVPPKVATLGRWTQPRGKKAGAILAVLDEFTCDKVKQAAVDENLHQEARSLMVVEPEK